MESGFLSNLPDHGLPSAGLLSCCSTAADCTACGICCSCCCCCSGERCTTTHRERIIQDGGELRAGGQAGRQRVGCGGRAGGVQAHQHASERDACKQAQVTLAQRCRGHIRMCLPTSWQLSSRGCRLLRRQVGSVCRRWAWACRDECVQASMRWRACAHSCACTPHSQVIRVVHVLA